MRVAGIMSGTSLDGIDVAVVDITGRGWSKRISTIAAHSEPYPAEVRRALLGVSNREANTGDVARLHFLLPELYAEAVRRTCAQAGLEPGALDLVGCHGQTIFHEGQARSFLGRSVASTLQLGEPAVLAERLGVPVVANFRPRDMAAGGRGAPLVPYVDYLLFRHRRRTRVALNIGGIGNITVIPAGAGTDQVVAGDTGPGNMVIDALVEAHTGGERRFDENGTLARHGRVNQALLDLLLADPYYSAPPPKSAGREQYGPEFVHQLQAATAKPEDAIATATAFAARTIALSIQRFAPQASRVQEVIAAGGGVHNATLMQMLREQLPGIPVTTTAEYGISPDAKEAVAFAVLAYETWHHRPANLPAATGARHAVVLGSLTR